MAESRKQFVLLLAVLLALPIAGAGSLARADYIKIEATRTVPLLAACLQTSVTDLADSTRDSGAGTVGDPMGLPGDEQAKGLQLRQMQEQVLPLSLLASSGTGFQSSGSGTTTTSFGSIAADIETQEAPRSLMVEWLRAERTLHELTPIADGLFHPPRGAC